jgi:dihydrofolate reductase
MRKIILGLAVSLDNLIEGPNGEYDWCFTDQDYGMNDFLKTIDAVFYGRKSYELMQQTEGPDMFGHLRSYVFSNSLQSGNKKFDLVSGDVISEVKRIKQMSGKDIWLFGGASLTGSLMTAGLVDILWLSVHPIILGQGKPLFTDIKERKKLKLLDSKTYNTGLVSVRYEIDRPR